MFGLCFPALVLAAVAPVHSDYSVALRQAQREKKDLVIYFRPDDRFDHVLQDKEVKSHLSRYVFLQVPPTYKHQGRRLLDELALNEMMGQPGLVVVSTHDKDLPTYMEVISAHPFVGSQYGWVPEFGADQVQIVLDLPRRATLTQRSMIYAVRVHPERPRSVFGRVHWSLLAHAERHSARQASLRYQHHADIIAASARFQQESGIPLGVASEVVAESWGRVVGGENVLEAAFSCVDAWRHSSGHWSAVSRPCQYFAYDIARGSNGTWYATGIFSD
jgi:hypothetical protein